MKASLKAKCLLALLVSSLLFASACQQGKVHRPGETGNTSITLELWTLQMRPFADLIEPALDAFEEAHPGVSVTWVDVPFNEGKKRILTAALAGDAPDVMNLNPDFAAVLAERGVLLDMARALPDETQARYLPAAWEALSLNQAGDEPTTQRLGIPWYLTSPVTLINKALVGKHPAPTTAEALQGFCQQLASHQNRLAYCLMPVLAENGAFLKRLALLGVPLGQRQLSQSPVAVGYLKLWGALYQAGLIPAESLTEGHRGALDRFQSGQIAMLNTGSNFVSILHENAPALYQHLKIAPRRLIWPPANAHQANTVELSAMLLAVPVTSQHRALALELALMLTNTQHQLALSRRVPVLPSTRQGLATRIAELEAGTSESSTPLEDQALLQSARQAAHATSAPGLMPNQSQLNAVADDAVQAVMLGRQDAKTALRRVDEALAELAR